MQQGSSSRPMQFEPLTGRNEPRLSRLDTSITEHISPVLPSQNAFALQQKRKYSWDQTIGARVRESQRVREHANNAHATSTYMMMSSPIHFSNQNVQTPKTNRSTVSLNSRTAQLPIPSSTDSTPQSNSTQSPAKQSSWASKSQSLDESKPLLKGHSTLKHEPHPEEKSQTFYRISNTETRHGRTIHDLRSRSLYPMDPADLVDAPDSNLASHALSQASAMPMSVQRPQLSAPKYAWTSTKATTPHHKRIRPRDDDSWKKHGKNMTAETAYTTDSDLPSTAGRPLGSPTDQIRHMVRGKAKPTPNTTAHVHVADWGRLPFRQIPQGPDQVDTPHLARSKTRKFVPSPINPRTAQAQAAMETSHDLKIESRSPSTEIRAPMSPQKRVMQKVFSFVKGRPVPVHPVASQGQDFISGPLPPGITPSKAAQVLGTASTNSRHVLPLITPGTIPQTPMTPSISGLDLAGTDIHPALRPQFQARPSAGPRKRSNTFDSSASLYARGAELTPLGGDSQYNTYGGLAGLGLQYYEENTPPTPPRKDSSYRLPLLQQQNHPREMNMSLTPRIQIDAAKPYPQPSRSSGHMAQSVHGAYETASSSSLTYAEASPSRISKPTSGFSVAASPQLLPKGHLPSLSYVTTPPSGGRGGRVHRIGTSEASTGSPTPKKRASLLPSPLRQATGPSARPITASLPSHPTTIVGQELTHPSFQSASTVGGSVDPTDAGLQSLEARYASLEERMTARLAELAGAQSVLVRGVGEWAANCDALARSTAQIRQGVMGLSLEVVEALQEVHGLASGLREMRESFDLMGRRMRGLERGCGETRAETKGMTETMALMQQRLGGIARSVDSISIFLVRSEEHIHD